MPVSRQTGTAPIPRVDSGQVACPAIPASFHPTNHTMANRQHVLLAKARAYAREQIDLRPADCDYDLLAGAWVHRPSGGLFVESADPKPPGTKKHDVETGEDQKGY